MENIPPTGVMVKTTRTITQSTISAVNQIPQTRHVYPVPIVRPVPIQYEGVYSPLTVHTQNETMAAGTAFAISYQSDITKVTDENLVVFTVKYQ